jgi:hypothetical protein
MSSAPLSQPRTARRGVLYPPREVAVIAGEDHVPLTIGDRAVAAVREQWQVEEGWWSQTPLRRRYFELVLEDGSDVVVFRDHRGHWFRQRG